LNGGVSTGELGSTPKKKTDEAKSSIREGRKLGMLFSTTGQVWRSRRVFICHQIHRPDRYRERGIADPWVRRVILLQTWEVWRIGRSNVVAQARSGSAVVKTSSARTMIKPHKEARRFGEWLSTEWA